MALKRKTDPVPPHAPAEPDQVAVLVAEAHDLLDQANKKLTAAFVTAYATGRSHHAPTEIEPGESINSALGWIGTAMRRIDKIIPCPQSLDHE